MNDKCKERLTDEKLTAASDEGRVMLFSEEAFLTITVIIVLRYHFIRTMRKLLEVTTFLITFTTCAC